MEQGKRGLPLTLFAIAFDLLAIADLTKPLSKTPGVGLVFFGTKLNGTADLITAPLFAAFLAIYAIGIWRMKRYALQMSHAYATYVFINLLVFDMKHHDYSDTWGCSSWLRTRRSRSESRLVQPSCSRFAVRS